MNLIRKPALSLAGFGILVLLTSCDRAPSFNILGSFFPAWLICIVAGVALTAVAHWLLARAKLETAILWPIVVYPCLAAFSAFTLWLTFFS
jgi:hypothetical protein